MSRFFFIICAIILCSCTFNNGRPDYDLTYKNTFDSILNSYDCTGSLLIFDPSKKIYYSNDFEWAETGHIPASTFKIPNTIISLETGVMKNENTIIKWDGKKRDFESWEKDMTLKEAFRASCVPCYQEIARKTGTSRMTSFLNKLQYPTMDVQDSTLDHFWLRGKSRITSFEQIEFLQRFYTKKLAILNTTRDQMLDILRIEQNKDYTFSGKTGWSYNDQSNNGWFVGFLEKQEKIYYFAINLEPKDSKNLEKFIPGRQQAVLDAFKAMQLI